jgi:hypothetical protein
MTVGSRLATRPGWRARMGPSGVARIDASEIRGCLSYGKPSPGFALPLHPGYKLEVPGMPLIRQAVPGFRLPLHPGYKLEVKGPPSLTESESRRRFLLGIDY